MPHTHCCVSSPTSLIYILRLIVINERFLHSNSYLLYVWHYIYLTGWYLWPVKGCLNNQCDLVEVLLVSIQFNCAALFEPFLFFWSIFKTNIFLILFLFCLSSSECHLLGMFDCEKGRSQLTAFASHYDNTFTIKPCMLPKSKQQCL